MNGGYEVGAATLYNKAGRLRATEKEMLGCQRCGKLLRDAMQLITCGCRYCKSCVKTIIGEVKASEAQMKCPKDGEIFVKSDVCLLSYYSMNQWVGLGRSL